MRARTGSFETEYRTSGSGPWVVLAHCLGSSMDLWKHQVGPLGHDFSLLLYDLRGQGRSGNPGISYSIGDLADDLTRLLDELSIERASIVGLSMGGMVAQSLAARHGDRVDKLVLADTSSHYQGEVARTWRERAAVARSEGMGALADATMTRWFTEGFRRSNPDEVAWVQATFAATESSGYALACEALAGLDLRAELGRIGVPTLVMAGDQDHSCTPEVGRQIASAIRGGRFELIDSAAHASCVEQAERFTRLTLDFLR